MMAGCTVAASAGDAPNPNPAAGEGRASSNDSAGAVPAEFTNTARTCPRRTPDGSVTVSFDQLARPTHSSVVRRRPGWSSAEPASGASPDSSSRAAEGPKLLGFGPT